MEAIRRGRDTLIPISGVLQIVKEEWMQMY